MNAQPEFSRPIRVDGLSPAPRPVAVVADEAERGALARRFGLPAIGCLEAEVAVSRHGDIVVAAGTLRAEVVQSCIATGEPVEAKVEEDFRLEFRPPPAASTTDEGVELGEGELDVVFYDGAAIDLGEAVAETLPLALDPYPRSPGAEAALKAAGVTGEAEAKAEASPFAALAALKGKIGK